MVACRTGLFSLLTVLFFPLAFFLRPLGLAGAEVSILPPLLCPQGCFRDNPETLSTGVGSQTEGGGVGKNHINV